MNAILAKIGAIAAVFVLGLLSGVQLQAWRIDSEERAQAVEQLDRERAEVKRLNQLAFDVGQALGAEKRGRDADAEKAAAVIDRWKRKGVAYVQCPNTAAPQAVAASAVRFDPGYAREWNRGLCLALPAGRRGDCLAAVDAVGGSAGSSAAAAR